MKNLWNSRHRLAALTGAALLSLFVVAACDGSSDSGDDAGSGSGGAADTGGINWGGGGGWQTVDAGGPGTGSDAGTVPQPDIVTPACSVDDDCTGELPYCNQAVGECIECRSTEDCGGEACLDGRCANTQQPCAAGTRTCQGTEVVVCGGDGYVADRIDCAPGECADGRCVICREGSKRCEGNDVVQCNADQTAYEVVESCPEDGSCVAGYCLACYPGTGSCGPDGKAMRCSDDGSEWTVTDDCPSRGLDCIQGNCVSPCTLDPKGLSNAGCDFWAVDLDNAYVEDATAVYDAQNAQFAVIVSNASSNDAAEVTVTMPDGRTQTKNVAGGDLEKFLLPPDFSLDGTSLNRNAFRIQSNRPVTVYQFNPLENVDVFSNDASVLLPTPSLGTEYYAASLATGFGGGFRGYITVVATEPDTTTVTVRPTANMVAGPGVPAMTAGTEYDIDLEYGEVLNLEQDGMGDISGSWIRTSQRAVVFSGHEAAVTGSECCADHLEQQLLPVSRWGKEYVAAGAMQRGVEQNHWMLVAAKPGTRVTLNPMVTTLPATLEPGEPVRFQTTDDFIVTATEPVMLVQYLASSFELVGAPPYCNQDSQCPQGYTCPAGSCEAPMCDTQACPPGHVCAVYEGLFGSTTKVCEPIGDPAMILGVPARQFRKEFVFLTPDSYLEDYLTIMAPNNAVVQLDGETIPASEFTRVFNSGYSVHRTLIGDGVHTVSADQGVGITVYGYDNDVSYGYPGGLGLEALTAGQ